MYISSKNTFRETSRIGLGRLTHIINNQLCKYWNVFDVFFMIKTGSTSIERNTHRVSAIFTISFISNIYTINMIFDCWRWPWSPGWGSVCQIFPLWHYSFFPPSILQSCVSLTYPHQCCFFIFVLSNPSLSGTTKCFRIIISDILPTLVLESDISPRILSSFLIEKWY